jgi:transposase
LTDAEWAVVEPPLSVHDPHAGGPAGDVRAATVLDSILHRLVSGRVWRLLHPRQCCPGLIRVRRADGGYAKVVDTGLIAREKLCALPSATSSTPRPG